MQYKYQKQIFESDMSANYKNCKLLLLFDIL
jgi:hypothetical protein